MNRLSLRSAALLSCATILALASPAPAVTFSPPVKAVTGDLSPLYGRINPFYGPLSAAYGRINPFYGRINPFYGRINPFWGDVTGFWGRINPFVRTTDASTTAFYGTNSYDPFWGKANPYTAMKNGLDYGTVATFWTNTFNAWTPILSTWNNATTSADAAAVATQIQNNLVNPTSAFWSPVIAKAGKAGTTTQTLIGSQLAAAGITFNANGTLNSDSLLKSDPSQRAMLFINLYDNLMDYAGTGHVDWWMGATGWSPALAETQGTRPSGSTATPMIGMIDFVIANGTHIPKQITQYGSTVFADGHGAAVGSLIIGATDGSGVLGVLPPGSGNVVVYDPYDDTGTTNWTDVGTGIAALSNTIFKDKPVPMGVLNASLGVPGWTLHPGWNDALATAGAHGHDLVIAAGNDGSTQFMNVWWNFAANPTLIIVGAVGADGTISNFSNRPGEACLLPTNSFLPFCTEANKLKYRFIVAPGELILVSDGLGGHMRQSGTSLAAPLVSGAIALLQTRWPWLSNYPDETASIILKSATPKGANPGADPVYGVGELNIAASQAPLDFRKLVYYQASNGKAGTTPLPLSTVVTQLKSGTQSSWDASGLSYSAIEKIGNTYRDFQIPLSSKLVGQNVTTAAGGQAYQSFLSSALRAQANYFAVQPFEGNVTALSSGFARSTVPVTRFGSTTFRVAITPSETSNAYTAGSRRYDTDAAVTSEAGSVNFGFGNGAAALDGSAGFSFRSDYDLNKGGANPLLGLASGGAYVGARVAVLPGLEFGIGTTDRRSFRNLSAFGLQPATAGEWVDRYAAQAQNVSVAYAVSERLKARATFTHLHEDSALLGIQSIDRADLGSGSATNGVTAGVDLAIGHGILLSGSATVARTRAAASLITTDNLTSASAALAVTKTGLFARRDQLRLTLASPMHTVGGQLSFSSVGVVDRDTGALDVLTQSFGGRTRMPLAGQAMYGMALASGAGEFSLFGRIDSTRQITSDSVLGYAAGAQLQFEF